MVAFLLFYPSIQKQQIISNLSSLVRQNTSTIRSTQHAVCTQAVLGYLWRGITGQVSPNRSSASNQSGCGYYLVSSPKSHSKQHPTDCVRPNGQLAVNCKGFGCTIKGYFVIIHDFYRVFLWEALQKAINIMNRFCMTTKFSKHECNHQLSYLDHSRYDNANFHCNL